MNQEPLRLNLGCGPFTIEGFTNIDIKQDAPGVEVMDLTELPWKWDGESVDVIVSYHFLQELPWRQLVPLLREAYRVLKPEGVMRIGVPHIDSGYDLDFLLGWGNINLFSKELLTKVYKQIGFSEVVQCEFNTTESKYREVFIGDNRPMESLFLEAIK